MNTNLNFSQPNFLPNQQFEVKIHEDVENKANAKDKASPPVQKKYVMEIRHQVSVEHASNPLKITVSGEHGRDWAVKEFHHTLDLLNSASLNEFKNIFDPSQREEINKRLVDIPSYEVLAMKDEMVSAIYLGSHKVEKLDTQVETGKSNNTDGAKSSSIPLHHRIGRAISNFLQTIVGKKKESLPNESSSMRPIANEAGNVYKPAGLNIKEDERGLMGSDSFHSSDLSEQTEMSLDLDDDVDFSDHEDSFSIEGHEKNEVADEAHLEKHSNIAPQSPVAAEQSSGVTPPPVEKSSELTALKVLLDQTGKNTRIKQSKDTEKTLSVETMRGVKGQTKSGAQPEALRSILKTLITKTDEKTMGQAIALYVQVSQIKDYSKEIAKHSDLFIMDSAISILINLKSATSSGVLTPELLTKHTQQFNQLTTMYRMNPQLQQVPELKSVILGLSKELQKAKADLGELPNLPNIDAYIKLIGSNGNEKVKETIIWGHRNNDETKDLIHDIKNKIPLESMQENKNVLKFTQNYLDNGHSMPIDPQEKQVVLASIIDIADALRGNFPDEAVKLKKAAAEEIHKSATGYLNGVRLPSNPDKRNELFRTLGVLAENLSEDEDTKSIGERLAELSDQAKSLQAAGPVASVEKIAIPDANYFEEHSASEVFQNLTAIFGEKFIAVDVNELDLQGWAKNSTKEYAQTLSDYTNFFNKTSTFAAYQILKISTQAGSAEQKNIAVANNLKKILEIADLAIGKEGQTNAVLAAAIGAAIFGSSVDRIIKEGTPVNALLSDSDREIRDKLQKFLDSSASYQNQRLATNQASLQGETTIPFLGIIASDVTFLLDGNQSLSKGEINSIQANSLAGIKKNITLQQKDLLNKSANLEKNPALKDLEQNISAISISEDELYQQSLALLPRQKSVSA